MVEKDVLLMSNADSALQDDMELAPDFFSYFAATSQLLSSDPSLFCVSSWNDHGQEQFVEDEKKLLRSDFFPGLGWMLDKEFWAEIRSPLKFSSTNASTEVNDTIEKPGPHWILELSFIDPFNAVFLGPIPLDCSFQGQV